MSVKHKTDLSIEIHPVSGERWDDLAQLFGAKGACGGCWCMLWRLKRAQFEAGKGEKNRRAMKAVIDSGKTPGLLAYADGKPVGWCSVAPREHFPALENSRILQPVDEQPVWSITCLFVEKKFRRQGISVALLRAAAEHVKRQGGKIVEGYPTEPKKDRLPDVFVWTGLASAYQQAGFVECARRSETRPIMRFSIKSN
jgi:GNAT superfamily N-acetyltransferase